MPKKILIIDDDPIVVKYLEAVFSDNGYETCSASSTMEGLEVIKQEKPDLITLDLQMPGEWGPRFYRKLRKDKDLRDTPVIVVSGIDGDHAIKDAIAFVKKPFDPEKLGWDCKKYDWIVASVSSGHKSKTGFFTYHRILTTNCLP
jgi:CheY-like chemotaxis protein